MNTTPKSPRLTPLKKNHQRWTWMAGATAAAAASPAAHAATAQITLVNDMISNAGNHLSLSITSGHPFGTVTFVAIPPNASSQLFADGKLGNSHKQFSFGAVQSRPNSVALLAGGILFGPHAGTAPEKIFALIPLKITDPNVAGGQVDTNALLDVEAFANGGSDESIALLSVFYSTPGNTTPNLTINSNTGAITGAFTNVGSSNNGVFTPASAPEPSGLALLALGAGGILARRQRRKAA